MAETTNGRWFPVGPADQIQPGKPKVAQAGRIRVAVFRVDGDPSLYAIQDVCTHDDGPLAEGMQDGGEIECPRHGARFDVRTGAALCMPAVTPVPAFKTRVVNGVAEIQLPEGA